MVDVRNGGGEPPAFRAVNQSNAEPTRVEDAAQAATVNTSHIPGEKVPSKATSKASSRRNSPQAAAKSDPRLPTQSSGSTSNATEPPPQSQPMTASNSASSHASAKEPKGSKESTAAPYGTRSRNRPGTSRVNYAEDVDMDFEMTNAPANGQAPETAPRTSLAVDGATPSAVGGKKGANANQNQGHAAWGSTGANPKDQPPPNLNIPGTSSFAANPQPNAAHPPKRRKNAASHATNGSQAASGSHAGSAAPSHPRRANANHGNNAVVPAAPYARESNMMTFTRRGAFLIDGKLESDDGRTVSVNDHVYLVCEPPGDPYYLCRIMEFLHVDGNPQARVESIRVNWYYRPRDVQRYANDTRLVYATMHSDVCPITSLRGRCQITHRSEIQNLDEYRKQPDSFWFNQCFDRFIHRWYDVIPTSQVTNVPDKVKKALDERWKYICLETSRVKELTSAVKTCKRCVGFCANNDSVECANCHNTYHMNCLRPPLPKKPARGFAWSCAPCSRAMEKKLEARRTPILGSGNEDGEDEEPLDEEEEEPGVETTAPSPENNDETEGDLPPGTQAEMALAQMWPMRYLGIHCRVEDALQYDDRAIYPRASSRLGPRHQANVNVWHGRPVELVKPAEIKKRYVKGSSHKKDAKLTKETVAAIEADKAEKAKRPKWVMDEPPGYVHRGEDHPNKDPKCTAFLQFKMPPLGIHSTRGEDDSPSVTPEQVEAYMTRARGLAKDVGVQPFQTDFLDRCLNLFMENNYDAEAALKQVKKIDRRKHLKIPELTKEEEKKWNEGVAKYGSEIRSVRLHVKTLNYADATRHYYMWKKTPKGKEIWGSYSNRKGKLKQAAEATETKLLDDVADDIDDSAFDSEKAMQRKRGFQCKFCNNRHSRQWRRAPGVSPGQTVAADGRASKANSTGYVLALCQRCANLWRKYAVKWENTDEIAKKVALGGGKAWKRRIDEELLREVYAAANEANGNGAPDYGNPQYAHATPVAEPPKKKQKTAAAPDSGASTPAYEPAPKKKEKPPPQPKAPTPPPVPAQPRLKTLPCAVCRQVEGPRLECAACRLTVHRSCYGVEDSRQLKWFCDTCKNDKKESVSYTYECVLCPHKVTEVEFYEPPKVSHKKKTDREREKERMERELVDKAREEYRQRQLEKGRPVVPREPLKRTADNNWVHVYCALWTPETRFTKPNRLDMVEGIGAPSLRYDVACKICKTTKGACVSCLHPGCHANFHVGCAHSAGYIFGFDITPVKATRRDTVPTVTINGETGTMTAAIWCKDHTPKTIVHRMNEEVEGTGLVALQLFAKEFKQADLLLTGTARKANLVDQSARAAPHMAAVQQAARRTSTVATQTPTTGRSRQSNAGLASKQDEQSEPPTPKPTRTCAKCKVDYSPKWWEVQDDKPPAQETAAQITENGSSPNGVQANGHSPPVNGQPNGSIDHVMTDAPPLESQEQSSSDPSEPSAVPSSSYYCQKCHWKKVNGKEDTPEPEKPQPVVAPEPEPESQPPPPPQQLPLRSPPVPAIHPVPQTLAPPWQPSVPLPPLQPHQPHQSAQTLAPLAVWGEPHGPVQLPPHLPPHGQPLPNGIGLPSSGPPHGHPPPAAAIYYPMHHPNAYPPYSGPHVHQSMASVPPMAAMQAMPGPMPPRTYYEHPYPQPPPHGPTPPGIHLNGNGPMVNGVHSPHMSYPHPHAPPRASESPFSGPPSVPQYALHHGSPVQMNNRPSTPRDAPPMSNPTGLAAPPAPPVERAGASASPSLHNLLH